MHYLFRISGLECQMCAINLEQKIIEQLSIAQEVHVNQKLSTLELELRDDIDIFELERILQDCAKVCAGKVSFTKI